METKTRLEHHFARTDTRGTPSVLILICACGTAQIPALSESSSTSAAWLESSSDLLQTAVPTDNASNLLFP